MTERSNARSEEDETTYFSFDLRRHRELPVEDTCCVTGEEVPASFCRFPDYHRGTMLVMSRKATIANLRDGTTIVKFKEVLVKRHGQKILKEYVA